MPPLTPLTARDLSLVAWAKSNAEDLPGGKVKCKHCDGTYTFGTKKNGQNDWSQHASFVTHLKEYHVNTTKHTLHVKVESHVAWAAKLEEQGRQASNSGPSLAHHFTRQEMPGDPLAEAKKHRTTVEWMVDFGIPHEALLDPRFEQIQMRLLPLVPAKNKLKEVIKGVATINREETTSYLRHKDVSIAKLIVFFAYFFRFFLNDRYFNDARLPRSTKTINSKVGHL